MNNVEKIKELEKKIREAYNSGVKRRDIYPLLKKDFDELYSTKQDYCDKLIAQVVNGMEKNLDEIKKKRAEKLLEAQNAKKPKKVVDKVPEKVGKEEKEQKTSNRFEPPKTLEGKIIRELSLGYMEKDVIAKFQSELNDKFKGNAEYIYNYVTGLRKKLKESLTEQEREALNATTKLVTNYLKHQELEKICNKVKTRFTEVNGPTSRVRLRKAMDMTAMIDAVHPDKVKRAVKTIDIDFYEDCMRSYTKEDLYNFAKLLLKNDSLSPLVRKNPRYIALVKLLKKENPELLEAIEANFPVEQKGISR